MISFFELNKNAHSYKHSPDGPITMANTTLMLIILLALSIPLLQSNTHPRAMYSHRYRQSLAALPNTNQSKRVRFHRYQCHTRSTHPTPRSSLWQKGISKTKN